MLTRLSLLVGLSAVTAQEQSNPGSLYLDVIYYDLKETHPDMNLVWKYWGARTGYFENPNYSPLGPGFKEADGTPIAAGTARNDIADSDKPGNLAWNSRFLGLVSSTLDENGKPVCIGAANSGNAPAYRNADETNLPLRNCETFHSWFNEVPCNATAGGDANTACNIMIPGFLELEPLPGQEGIYEVDFTENSAGNVKSYFPLDDIVEDGVLQQVGFGNEGNTDQNNADSTGAISHNYFFCDEVFQSFQYFLGDSLSFSGDDDVWVFVNNRLALDLGGLHPQLTEGIALDDLAEQLDIVAGGVYALKVFHCERQQVGSNYKLTTSLRFSSPPPPALTTFTTYYTSTTPHSGRPSGGFVGGHRDPHLAFAHGGKADFKGKDKTWYNLLSAKNISLNAHFEHADFHNIHRMIHGSMMHDLVLVIRTGLTGRRLAIEYHASAEGPHVATVREGDSVTSVKHTGHLVVENCEISVREKKMDGWGWRATHGQTLVVSTGKWEINAMSMLFPNPKGNPGKAMLNIKIEALYDADRDIVAPHGLIGQSYDGDEFAVDGAEDDYQATVDLTTKAMAEGAIEGSAEDYEMKDQFSTEFKFSRFDATSAKPRDVSALSGKKKRAVKSRIIGSFPDMQDEA